MGGRIDLRRQLQKLAFRQAGYFSAAQALDLRYSYQAQKYHVDRGNWQRIDRGIFRLPDWPADESDNYVRWSVWADGKGIISHQSAANVHGLGDFDEGEIHLTLPLPTKSRVLGAVLHQASLASSDVQRLPGFSVTSPLRTTLDLAASDVPQESLTTVIRDGISKSMLTMRRLRVSADAFGAMAALRVERALTEITEEVNVL